MRKVDSADVTRSILPAAIVPTATVALVCGAVALVSALTATSATLGPFVSATGPPVAVLVGAGNIADCSSNADEVTAALLETVDGTVFTLGDNAYVDGTSHQFNRCYAPSWGRPSIKARTKPVPGDHDYNAGRAHAYFQYFGEAAGDPTQGWYAYDAGAWRVYALNSNCPAIGGCRAGSAQELWLRADLAANPRACVAAMWHHARFSSGEQSSSRATESLWTALYEAGAELVLTAGDHHYERFAPQTPAGDLDHERGLAEFVVGTGGGPLGAFGAIEANSLVRNNDTHGVLRLELSPDSWSFRFVPGVGATFTDAGSGTCH